MNRSVTKIHFFVLHDILYGHANRCDPLSVRSPDGRINESLEVPNQRSDSSKKGVLWYIQLTNVRVP